MARTITLDGLQMVEVRVAKDAFGQIQVFARYNLQSGSQVIQTVYQEITNRLSPARRAAAASYFDATASDVAGFELA